MNNPRIYRPFFGLWIFAFLFFRPYPLDLIGNLGARGIDVGIVVLLFTYSAFVLLRQQLLLSRELLLISALLISMTILSLISTLYGGWVGASNLNVRDLFDSLRYTQFVVLVAFGYVIGHDHRFNERTFLRVVLLIAFASLLFGLVQKFAPGASYSITRLYTAENQGEMIFATERVTAFFGNPNTAALMMSGLIAYILAYLAAYRRLLEKSGKWRLYISSVVLLYFVLLCGSRTGLITLFGAFILYLMLTRAPWKWMAGVVLVFAAILSLQDIILEQIKSANAYLYGGVKLIFSGEWKALVSVGSSFFKRFDRWNEALEMFLSSPVIGLGSLRGVITSSTDNFYLYILARLGVVGLFLYLTTVAIVLIVSVSLISKNRHPFGYFMIILSSIVLVANITVEAQILINMAYLYYVSLGILLAVYRQSGLHAEASRPRRPLVGPSSRLHPRVS